MRPMTRRDMDKEGCAAPGCGHKGHSSELVLNQRCHPGAGMKVVYRLGNVEAFCLRCERMVGSFMVARGEPDPSVQSRLLAIVEAVHHRRSVIAPTDAEGEREDGVAYACEEMVSEVEGAVIAAGVPNDDLFAFLKTL